MRTLGVVLAGGRSTRFGSEKAVALVEGEPMIARVAAVLALGCERVAVNAPEGGGAATWAQAHGLKVLPDPPGLPDGPLAGVSAALAWASAEGAAAVATAPCDTPRLPAALVTRLAVELGDAPAALALTSDGPQPLCALWTPELRRLLADALAGGVHPSVQAWLRTVGAREVRFEDAATFANMNAPVTNRPARRI